MRRCVVIPAPVVVHEPGVVAVRSARELLDID
jgi:hypothetical protein